MLKSQKVRWALLCVIVFASAGVLRSETISLTTAYPSPAGIYRTLVTTWKTVLARDGGGVGIGISTPDASAQLHMDSTTQGFLPPRMTSPQRDAIASPASGLLVYNTTTNRYNFNSGTAAVPAWIVLGKASVDTTACTWRPSGLASLTGYAGAGAIPGADLPHANTSLWYAAACAADEVVWAMATHEGPALWEHHQIYCCKLN